MRKHADDNYDSSLRFQFLTQGWTIEERRGNRSCKSISRKVKSLYKIRQGKKNPLSVKPREGFVKQREIKGKLTYAKTTGSPKYQAEVPNDHFQKIQNSLIISQGSKGLETRWRTLRREALRKLTQVKEVLKVRWNWSDQLIRICPQSCFKEEKHTHTHTSFRKYKRKLV